MSCPSFAPALCAFLGAWFSVHHQAPASACWVTGSCFALFALCSPNLHRTRYILLCGAAFLLATASSKSVQTGPRLHGQLAISGKVLRHQDGLLILALNQVDGKPATGKIAVVGSTAPPGTQLHLLGRTKPLQSDALPGAWSRELSARAAGIQSLFKVQREVQSPGVLLSPFATAEHPAVLDRLVLGRKTPLPEDTATLLNNTGTRHLLAISGLHVGMVSLWGAWIFSLLGRLIAVFWRQGGLRFLPAAGACTFGALYAHSAGLPISSQRALIMVVLSWFCWSLHRPAQVWTLFSIALAATVFFSPGQVRSLSFCFSFSAVAGVLFATQWSAPKLKKAPRWVRWLGTCLSASIGAQLGCLCINAWVFQSVPLCAPFANLLAVPLVGLVVLPGAFLHVLGWAPGLWVADTGLKALLHWLPLMEGPIWHPAVGPVGAAGLVMALVVARHKGFALTLALLAIGLKSQAATGLRITHFAVGQGDAALIERQGKRVLVDAGPRKDAVLHSLRRQGIHSLDEIILTHAHQDHAEGIPALLQALDIGCLRLPESSEKNQRITALRNLAEQTNTPVCWGTTNPRDGFRLLQAQGQDLGINDASLVVEVSLHGHSALLTGDIEARGEAILAKALHPVTWLKVPHHGSRGASSSALIQATKPRFAIVSAGPENRFGHPHKATLARYKASRILQTHQRGSLSIHIGKHKQWIRERPPTRLWSAWYPAPP
jgi:competence protein ComEC